MSLTILLALLISTPPSAQNEPGSSNRYSNVTFGLSVVVPDGARVCGGDQNSQDHGVVILLDRRDAGDCAYDPKRRAILTFSFFDALDETQTLDGLRRWAAALVDGGREGLVPNGLQIDKFPSQSTRTDRPDGWVDIVVVAQSGHGSTAASHAPSVNHALTLHTQPSHLEKDLAIFRQVLASVRITDPR